MGPILQESADLFTFTEEVLNGKIHFFIPQVHFASILNMCLNKAKDM